LALTKLPPNINPKDLTPADLTAFPYEIIDVKSQDSIFLTAHDQRPVHYHYTMTANINNFTNESDPDYSKLIATGGTVVLWVLNPLASAAAEIKPVNISIFTKPAEDFQFAQLVSPDRSGQITVSLPKLIMHGHLVDCRGAHGEYIVATAKKSLNTIGIARCIGVNGPIEDYGQTWVLPEYCGYWGSENSYGMKGVQDKACEMFNLKAVGIVGYPVMGMLETAVGTRDDGLEANKNYYIEEVFYSGDCPEGTKITINSKEGKVNKWTYYFKVYPVGGTASTSKWAFKKFAALSWTEACCYMGATATTYDKCFNQAIVQTWPTGNQPNTMVAPLDEVVCVFRNFLGRDGEGSLQTSGMREQIREMKYRMSPGTTACFVLKIDGVPTTYFRLNQAGFLSHKNLKKMKKWQISWEHKPNNSWLEFMNFLDENQQLPTLGEKEQTKATMNLMRLNMEEQEFIQRRNELEQIAKQENLEYEKSNEDVCHNGCE